MDWTVYPAQLMIFALRRKSSSSRPTWRTVWGGSISWLRELLRFVNGITLRGSISVLSCTSKIRSQLTRADRYSQVWRSVEVPLPAESLAYKSEPTAGSLRKKSDK
jgi:hypothetical protein